MKDGNKFSTFSILKWKTFEYIFRNEEEELEIEETEMLEHDLRGERSEFEDAAGVRICAPGNRKE